jgi:hypothetical protein
MKNLVFLILLSVSALFFTNCEQDAVNPGNETEEGGERISFLKTSSYNSNDEAQDPFRMLYAELRADTVINFIMEYQVGEEFKLHKFDFVWNGKFEEDNDGKMWMNIKIYHKTKEENRLQTISDSAYVSIPDLSKIKEEDIDNTWLKLVNSTDESDVIILKYTEGTNEGDDTGNGDDEESPVDSSSVSSIAFLTN